MWFAKLYSDYVEIFENNKSYKISVKDCKGIYKTNFLYLLDKNSLYCYSKNELVFKRRLVGKDSNKIIINNDAIYISDEDTGSIYEYDLFGNLIKSLKIGEHISDFEKTDSFLFCTVYHENSVIKCNMFNIISEIELQNTPQSIIAENNRIYILSNDQFFSYIYMADSDMCVLKKITFVRQIGIIKKFNNKIVFSGTDYNYILNENLKILSQRKSTGELLCKYGNLPVLEKGIKALDTVNNLIYPL